MGYWAYFHPVPELCRITRLEFPADISWSSLLSIFRGNGASLRELEYSNSISPYYKLISISISVIITCMNVFLLPISSINLTGMIGKGEKNSHTSP